MVRGSRQKGGGAGFDRQQQYAYLLRLHPLLHNIDGAEGHTRNCLHSSRRQNEHIVAYRQRQRRAYVRLSRMQGQSRLVHISGRYALDPRDSAVLACATSAAVRSAARPGAAGAMRFPNS